MNEITNQTVPHMFICFITRMHASRFRGDNLYIQALLLCTYTVTFSRSTHARVHARFRHRLQCSPKITSDRRTVRAQAARTLTCGSGDEATRPVKLVRKRGDASPSHLLSLPLHRFSLTLTLLSLPDSQPLLKEEDEDENSECVLPLCRCSSTSANCPSFPGWCTRNTSFLSSARRR